MADFKDHITALTGLTISGSGTTPVESQLSEFLKDGIKDVVNRIIKLRPDELPKFCKTTNSTGSTDASVTITGEISSVAREHDSTTTLRRCTKISPDLRYLATDVDSIYYRSKYNPAYYELDGLIYSVPQASSTSNNDLVVTQVHYDIGIAHSDTYNNTGSNIENFPTEYEYLVGLYAAIKSLQNAMSALHGNSDISTAVGLIKTAVDQAAVAASSFISATDSIFGDEDTFLSANSQLTRVKEALDKAQHLMSDDASYNALTGVTDDVTNTSALYWLGDEDTEMVQAALSMVSTEIKRAQVHIQEWTSIGDMRVKEVQVALQEADGYSKEVQTRMADLGQEYQWYDKRYTQLKQEYDQSFAMMAPPQPQQAAGGRR